jgi:hypothetical protein
LFFFFLKRWTSTLLYQLLCQIQAIYESGLQDLLILNGLRCKTYLFKTSKSQFNPCLFDRWEEAKPMTIIRSLLVNLVTSSLPLINFLCAFMAYRGEGNRMANCTGVTPSSVRSIGLVQLQSDFGSWTFLFSFTYFPYFLFLVYFLLAFPLEPWEQTNPHQFLTSDLKYVKLKIMRVPLAIHTNILIK